MYLIKQNIDKLRQGYKKKPIKSKKKTSDKKIRRLLNPHFQFSSQVPGFYFLALFFRKIGSFLNNTN